jgi:hypothetical protein
VWRVALLIILNGMIGLFIASFIYQAKPERLIKFFKQRVAAQPAGPEKQENERIVKELEETLKQDPDAIVVGLAIHAFLNALVIIGALRMVKAKSYGWGMAASIITMIPCLTGCCCSGPLIGIWGLIVLSSPDVKAWLSPSAGDGDRT